jgi:hypothetical protein
MYSYWIRCGCCLRSYFHCLYLLHCNCKLRLFTFPFPFPVFLFLFYHFQGGIKAVMWTDTFQGAMMFVSFLAVIIKGNYDAGGSSIVFDRSYQSCRIEFFKYID